MVKFVVHKKGFFYTDEAFEVVKGAKGSIVGTYDDIEIATEKKEDADIISMQHLKGMNAVDFFFYHEDHEKIYKKLQDFYKKTFGLTIEDENAFNFPKEISKQQAKVFLDILEISFHDIVEYSEDRELIASDYNLEDQDLGEF